MSPYRRLKGFWVADRLYWDKGKKKRIDHNLTQTLPDIIMKVNYDSNSDTISCELLPCNLRSEITSKITTNAFKKTPEWEISQDLRHYTSDSIYILWSSEKINRNSPELASLFRGAVSSTAAEISAELAQNNKHSYSSQFLGGIATTVGEVAVNSFISAMFTPDKSMFILQGYLKIINDYLITGTLIFKYLNVGGDGVVYEDIVQSTSVNLVKWLPESNVIFSSSSLMTKKSLNKGHIWEPIILHTNDNISYDSWDSIANTRFAYCEEKIGSKVKLFSGNSSKGVQALQAYNRDQYKWLMLYNDSILGSHNYHGPFAIKNYTKPDIGMYFRNLDTKLLKKTKLTCGIYIDEIDEMGAAFVGGLKKGDIILFVNNQKIESIDDIDRIIKKISIGNWLTFRVLRKKKMLDLSIRVTW